MAYMAIRRLTHVKARGDSERILSLNTGGTAIDRCVPYR